MGHLRFLPLLYFILVNILLTKPRNIWTKLGFGQVRKMNLENLIKIIDARATADPSESWTAKLLSQGPEKCAEKFGEEAVEAIIEAVKGNNKN